MQYRNGQRLPPDAVGVPARLSVNPRARRLSIRIDGRAGEAVLVAPSERRLADAVAFARTRASWMRDRLAERPQGSPLEPGATIPLFGQDTRLIAAGGAGAARLIDASDGPIIQSGGEGEAFARRVENLLKRLARQVLVSIADTKSRWGSCSPHNRSIRYSWRVIMAPPAVADYLAAHEVAHLVHADHSPAYWSVVQTLVGDHRPFRKWLRENGPALHAVGR